MEASDFKYEATQQFVEDSSPVEEFDPNEYTKLDDSFEKDLTKEEKENAVTVPLQITTFPWNPKFEGLVFMIGKVNIEENEDGQTANLTYNYSVLSNPNELELSVGEDEESRDNPDNELLDCFIGRLVESLLYKMSQDQGFLEEMARRTGNESNETEGE